MLNYYIENFADAEKLVTFCRKYDEEIDVLYSKYLVSGKSTLGVMSLVGNVVGINIITSDRQKMMEFADGLDKLKN